RTLKQKLALMREQLGSLNGQIRRIERSIQQNQEQRDDALRRAHAGRGDAGFAHASRMQARHAVKLDESNQNLAAAQHQLETLFGMLKKLHDASELVLHDMRSTVEIKSRERESIRAAYSAYKSTFAILQNESKSAELYDRAMEFLNDDYARKLGEI